MGKLKLLIDYQNKKLAKVKIYCVFKKKEYICFVFYYIKIIKMKKLLWLAILAISVLWFGFATNTGSINTWSRSIVKKVEVKKVIKKDDKKKVKVIDKKVVIKNWTWLVGTGMMKKVEVKKTEVKKSIVKTDKKWDAICVSGEISISAYTYTITKWDNKWQKVNVPSYCRKIEKKK